MSNEKVNHVHDGNGDDNDDYHSRDYDYGQLLMQGQRPFSVAAFTAAFAVFQKPRPGNHGMAIIMMKGMVAHSAMSQKVIGIS